MRRFVSTAWCGIPPAPLILLSNAGHAWRLDLDHLSACWRPFEAVLSAEERIKADVVGFRSEKFVEKDVLGLNTGLRIRHRIDFPLSAIIQTQVISSDRFRAIRRAVILSSGGGLKTDGEGGETA
jgi:hypothetical protein